MKFLIGINCFTTVMGFAVLIASSYARSQMSSDNWSGIISQQNAAALGIATGLFTLVLSLVGCVGAAARQKRMLCCYLLGLLIVLCFQIGSAVMMTNYATALQIRNESAFTQSSSLLTSSADIAINNGAFSAFIQCCSGCPTGCNNTAPGAFTNATLSNCAGNNTCPIVQPCNGKQSKCFVYPAGRSNIVVPPINIPQTLCTALASVSVSNHYVVGQVKSGSCGGGNPAAFLQDMDTVLSTSLIGVASFFTFVAVIEGIALIAGIYLLFCAVQTKISDEDEQVFV